jgi:Tfp pilus assembly protein PilN
MESVNLIPAFRRDARRRRRHLRVSALACGAYAVLLACGLVAAHVLWDAGAVPAGGAAPLEQQLAAADDDVRRLTRDAEQTREELARTRASLEASRTIGGQPDWSVLLALLAETTGDDVVLRSVSVAPPLAAVAAPATPAVTGTAKPPAEVVLELAGVGQTQLAVSRHVLRLEQTGLFAKVTLIDTSREPFLNSPAIAFRLQCAFGDPLPYPGAAPLGPAAAADAGGINR